MEAIEQLPAKYREVILLRDIQQFTYEEIEQVLNIPGGTVRSRINRARSALKRTARAGRWDARRQHHDAMQLCPMRFSAYIDHDLDEDDEAELLEDLAHCSECSEELASLKETLGALQALPVVDPGPDFYAGIQKMIHAPGSASPRRAGGAGPGRGGCLAHRKSGCVRRWARRWVSRRESS